MGTPQKKGKEKNLKIDFVQILKKTKQNNNKKTPQKQNKNIYVLVTKMDISEFCLLTYFVSPLLFFRQNASRQCCTVKNMSC